MIFSLCAFIAGYSSNGLGGVGVGKTTSIDPHSHLRQPGNAKYEIGFGFAISQLRPS